MGTVLKNIAAKAVPGALLGAAMAIASACSPGKNTFGGPTPTPTPAPARMLVSDNTSGAVNVVDAKTDLITKTVAVPSPGKMISAGGITVVQSTIASSVGIFDNATETIRFNVAIPALPVDVALTPDGKTAWVAENNGTVQTIDTATGAISGTFTVAGVQRLVMGPQGTSVLAFNDSLAINFSVITGGLVVPLGNAGLNHPANGVFAGDDQDFFVMSCGAECGGTQSNIAPVKLNVPGGPAIGPFVPVSGATVGLVNGTLFVAGSPATGLNAGTFQGVNLATFTAGTPVAITDGRHNLMSLTSNGRIYVGATGCTLGATNPQNLRQGCLNIFDTATQTAVPVLLPAGRPNGDVTGLAPVSGRNVIYVVQGGVLDIFDINTNTVSTTATAPTFPGTVLGVVQLSP